MQEDREEQNDSDSINSEVVMFSQSPNLEFSLADQQHMTKEARQEYEVKLDEKLKELGLYEEGMTIHQKEELLAVIVVSCETAEQEETKRQILHELLEGPGDMSRNDIEFTFQESAWLANEGSLLQPTSIVCPETSLSPNISSVFSCSADFDAALEEKHFNDLLNSNSIDEFLEGSPEILECLSASKNTSDLQQPSTSRDMKTKMQPFRQSIQKKDRMSTRSTGSFTNPANEDQTCLRTGEIIDKKILCKEEKIQLEESMAFWTPCLSPEEKSLSSSRFESQEKQGKSKFSCKPDCGKKHHAYLEDFANALFKRRKSKPVPLSKPYLLSHRGLRPKKVNKLDSYDRMIGVQDEANIDELLQELNYIQNNLSRNESVSRISGSAFKCVKPGTSRKINCSALALKNETDGNIENTFRTTRSGTRYGYQKPSDKSVTKKQTTSIEISKREASQLSLLNKNEIENLISLQDFLQDSQNNSDNVCEKLPEFNNLRPDVFKTVNAIHPKASIRNQKLQNCLPDSTSEQSSSNVAASHSSEHEHHLVSSSLIESDSSDNSVIDVETIVDDEIQKFVLKRKMLQNHHIGNKPKTPSCSKRVKKNVV